MTAQRTLFLSVCLMALGMTGTVYAQSDAMQESYEANEESLNTGDGVEPSDEPMSSGTGEGVGEGESEAAQAAMEAVEAETDEATSIEQDASMRSLDAEGASDAAAEAQKQE
ncbi:hypothetical protein [Salinicola avicenniae]|uniref:hypothetical protein n=1 Tax=Salinicola avicenniae TaxID=2916836 RepID=UPI0020731316|nr:MULTISPECIES: hypothetical protein [unclassified Salinicola]